MGHKPRAIYMMATTNVKYATVNDLIENTSQNFNAKTHASVKKEFNELLSELPEASKYKVTNLISNLVMRAKKEFYDEPETVSKVWTACKDTVKLAQQDVYVDLTVFFLPSNKGNEDIKHQYLWSWKEGFDDLHNAVSNQTTLSSARR